MSRLRHFHAIYTGACKAIMWLTDFVPEALDNMDDDPATLLSRENVGSIQPDQLSQCAAFAVANHQATTYKAKRILNESELVYRVALFDGFIKDVMEAVLADKPELFDTPK